MNQIVDEKGNVFEYNPENGLISRNNVIVSGENYEPVFLKSPDDSFPPRFTGIYFKFMNKILTKSGKLNQNRSSNSL